MSHIPFILTAFILGVVVGVLGRRVVRSQPARHSRGEPAPKLIARGMRLTALDAEGKPTGPSVPMPGSAVMHVGSGAALDLDEEGTEVMTIDWRDGAPRCGRPGCRNPEQDVTIAGDPQGTKYCSMLCAHADAFRYTPVRGPTPDPLGAHARSWDDLYDGPPEEAEHG